MKIIVNTRLLLPNRLEGIGWVSYEILSRMVKNHPEHQFVFLFDRPFDRQFVFASNVQSVVLFPPARHPYLWHLYYEVAVRWALWRFEADVFISPDSMICLHSNVPSISVMHDLNYEYQKQWLPAVVARYYQKYMPRFARKSAKIIAVSAFTKNDIVRLYDISPEKIAVIHNAANAAYQPLALADQENVRKQYSNGCRYFVSVGSLHPRKNVANLLRAFNTFKTNNHNDIKLVIVGVPMWGKSEMDKLLHSLPYASEIIFTGYLPNVELAKVVASAIALVYVSLFEGFGIPIVEAFCAGTAVITSNTTSMPEVAADAALLVNPTDSHNIAAAMQQLATDEGLRKSLIEKGFSRKNDFSWEKSAAAFWDVITEVAQKKQPRR